MRKILLLLPFFLWTCGGDGGSPTEPLQPPIVQNINLEVTEDTPETFAFVGTEPNNLSFFYSISTQPKNGTALVSGSNGIYIPNENFNGQDTFQYIATSPSGNSNIGTVLINIAKVNDAPVVENILDIEAILNQAISITLVGSDIDNDNLTFSLENNPTNGTVSLNENQATYTGQSIGSDSFTFKANDGTSDSNIGIVTINVSS